LKRLIRLQPLIWVPVVFLTDFVTKRLVPRIMDSVIVGLQNRHFETLPERDVVDKLVVQYSNAVLKPYGVVIKSLQIQYFESY